MYAIVRCGGKQEKVAVDDVLNVEKLTDEVGATVTFPAVLVVDGKKVVSDPARLAKYKVTAEILGNGRGPKINIMHYRNKTGYKRRLGHRQPYTQVKITGIKAGRAASSKAESSQAEPSKAASSGSASGQATSSGSASGQAASSKVASTTEGE